MVRWAEPDGWNRFLRCVQRFVSPEFLRVQGKITGVKRVASVGRFALLLIIVAAALAGLQRRGRRKAGATKLSVPSTGLNSSQAEKRIFQMLDVDGDSKSENFGANPGPRKASS
eukprot:768403-Amphidinium_carterae.1